MTLTRKQMRERITSGPTFWMGGAYDALSALLVDQSDFDGVFTTGFGISASLLGQPDVELYTLTENLGVVNRVTNVVTKPVFADADTGYGNVINVMRTVREFEKTGVAAISLEDQLSPKRCPAAAAKMPVVALHDAIAKIKAATDARRDPDFLIVARTDVLDPSEARRRLRRGRRRPDPADFTNLRQLRGFGQAEAGLRPAPVVAIDAGHVDVVLEPRADRVGRRLRHLPNRDADGDRGGSAGQPARAGGPPRRQRGRPAVGAGLDGRVQADHRIRGDRSETGPVRARRLNGQSATLAGG